jgi:hypothetical protein
MSEERLKLMGRLESEKLKAEEYRLKMRGLISSVRNLLDGYAPLDLLECRVAAQQAMELAIYQEAYREALERIAAMKRDLGM